MSAARLTLPRHHVARPRLVDLLLDAPVSLLVAGGGYGKSVLGAELAGRLRVATVVLPLDPGDGEPELLIGRLARAFRRAALSDLAEAVTCAGPNPIAAVDRLLDAMHDANDSVLVIVDEVGNASTEGARLLAYLAGELPTTHKLVLLGRTLPTPVLQLGGMPGVAELGTAELAFTLEEMGVLLRERDVPHGLASRLVTLCGGWPLAATLAVERLARAADVEEELEQLAAGRSLMTTLVDGQLRSLEPGVLDAVLQLAHLPHLTAELGERSSGVPGVIETAATAGLPFEAAEDSRVTLPDTVREVLMTREALRPDVALRAAAAYVEAGLVREAIRVLVGAGADDAAAATVASLRHQDVSRFDLRELRSLLATITPYALDSHPRAWLHLARACEAAAEAKLRTEVLERAARNVDGELALQREIEAEQARDLVRDGHVEEAAALAERLLASAGPEELQTRVRALHVLGRTHAWRGGEDGLAFAEPLLVEAADLYGRLGLDTHRAHALLALAYDVQTLGGRFGDAVETLERALAGLPGRSRLRGILLVFHAEALIDQGRLQEAEASLVEAERLGALLGDARTLGYTAWLRARAAASSGDAGAVRSQLAEAERHPGEWLAHHSGVEFLAEAAALLDQVGLAEPAQAYLGRARARRSEAPRYVLLAEGAIEARSGDPALAEQILAEAETSASLEVRERWRVALLRAWAAHRAGDAAACRAFVHQALGLVERMGSPELPARREPAVTEVLRRAGAFPDDSSADAGDVGSASVVVLGAFAIRQGGAEVGLPSGRPTALVKLLAALGPRLPAERAIEALWPGVDPVSGRKRLRNVLNRLRDAAGDLILRDGEVLSLQAAEIDAQLFAVTAVEALGLHRGTGAPDRARAALALYGGDLLPDDRYEDWTIEPRERLRGRALALLDLLAEHAETEGDVDEALRLLARAIEADRLDESRYLRMARLLLRQGKRGRALETLRVAAGALRELAIEPSPEHRELVRSARS